ncbi:RNA-directed DNA polymerase, eukaryota [Tanacetum coccineum]
MTELISSLCNGLGKRFRDTCWHSADLWNAIKKSEVDIIGTSWRKPFANYKDWLKKMDVGLDDNYKYIETRVEALQKKRTPSKSDKRFGFVRFIKVANVQWLVTNLCTIWVGSFRLQANVARFQRKPLNQNTDQPTNKKMNSHVQGEVPKENMFAQNSGSFARAVKKGINIHQEEVESKPALVLDDSCLNIYDLSTALMGKVKVFNSLSNLKLVLTNEGFADIKLKYMGGLWVLIEFHANLSKEKFMANTSVVSWFSHLQQASNNVFTDERITWLDIEGKVFWIRGKEAGGWTPDFVEEDEEESVYDDVVSNEGNLEANEGQNNPNSLGGESDVEEVSETIFEKVNSQTPNKDGLNDAQSRTHSDDPFSIYDLLKKKKDSTESDSNSDNKMQYPPGFTPSFNAEEKSNDMNVQREKDEHHSTNVQEEILSASGSMLQVMEDMVKVGQTMSYNMEGCLAQKAKNDWVKELCVKNKVNFMSLQETKMETMDLFNIKRCWGNLSFDHVYSPSVGNSGGILCVWDPRMFRKDNSTVSDYFIMVRGEWIPNSKKIMIIAVYAPQDLSERKLLWEYLTLVINNWRGEVIIMGDFNEVRKQEERYGSVFNARGADAFNGFISNAGLEEIHLDTYLIIVPNFDFGPTPFRFFHYWFDIEGFDDFVKTTWINAQVTNRNAMGMFLKKLKFLKGKIRDWIKVKRFNSSNHKTELKDQLATIDKIVDKGEGNSEILNNRSAIFKSLQDIEKLESMEMVQKTKIKWGIEGDENTKYYHGMLNKQRSQLAIIGVLVDGIWTDSGEECIFVSF